MIENSSSTEQQNCLHAWYKINENGGGTLYNAARVWESAPITVNTSKCTWGAGPHPGQYGLQSATGVWGAGSRTCESLGLNSGYGSWSISGWVNLAAITNYESSWVFYIANGGNMIGLTATGVSVTAGDVMLTPMFFATDSTGGRQISVAGYPNSTWHHFFFVYDHTRKNMSVYWDGAFWKQWTATTTNPAVFTHTTMFTFWSHKGMVADWRFYNRALTDEQRATVRNDAALNYDPCEAMSSSSSPSSSSSSSPSSSSTEVKTDACLVRYYTFDDVGTSSTTCKDISVANRTGVFVTSLGWPLPSYIAGRFGSGVELKGRGPVHINIQTGDLPDGNEPRSVCFWVDFKPPAPNAQHTIFKYGGLGSLPQPQDVGMAVYMYDTANGRLVEFHVGVANVSGTYSSTLTGWQHFACVYNPVSGAMQVYMNGQLLTSGVASPSDVNTAYPENAQIGDFAGSIDDFQLYRRALTADEVLAIYAGGSACGGDLGMCVLRDYSMTTGNLASGTLKDLGNYYTPAPVVGSPYFLGNAVITGKTLPYVPRSWNGSTGFKTGYWVCGNRAMPIGNRSFTLSFWADNKQTTNLVAYDQYLYRYGSETAGQDVVALYIKTNTSNTLCLKLGDSAAAPDERVATTLLGWHHYVITYDENTYQYRLYADGDILINGNLGRPLNLMPNPSTSYLQSAILYNCRSVHMAAVKMFSVVLTDQQIADMFHDVTYTPDCATMVLDKSSSSSSTLGTSSASSLTNDEACRTLCGECCFRFRMTVGSSTQFAGDYVFDRDHQGCVWNTVVAPAGITGFIAITGTVWSMVLRNDQHQVVWYAQNCAICPQGTADEWTLGANTTSSLGETPTIDAMTQEHCNDESYGGVNSMSESSNNTTSGPDTSCGFYVLRVGYGTLHSESFDPFVGFSEDEMAVYLQYTAVSAKTQFTIFDASGAIIWQSYCDVVPNPLIKGLRITRAQSPLTVEVASNCDDAPNAYGAWTYRFFCEKVATGCPDIVGCPEGYEIDIANTAPGAGQTAGCFNGTITLTRIGEPNYVSNVDSPHAGRLFCDGRNWFLVVSYTAADGCQAACDLIFTAPSQRFLCPPTAIDQWSLVLPNPCIPQGSNIAPPSIVAIRVVNPMGPDWPPYIEPPYVLPDPTDPPEPVDPPCVTSSSRCVPVGAYPGGDPCYGNKTKCYQCGKMSVTISGAGDLNGTYTCNWGGGCHWGGSSTVTIGETTWTVGVGIMTMSCIGDFVINVSLSGAPDAKGRIMLMRGLRFDSCPSRGQCPDGLTYTCTYAGFGPCPTATVAKVAE